MKSQLEFQLQANLCEFVSRQYPLCFFISDTVASLRLTAPQAQRSKRIQKDNFKTPDFLLLEGRGRFHSFFLELKIKTIFKQNGVELLKNTHVEAQAASIIKLREKGFYADFCWDFDDAASRIKLYLMGRHLSLNYIYQPE